MPSNKNETIEQQIIIKDFFKKFNKKEKIGPMNLKINFGELTLIVGESGSGKSVLINSIIGKTVRYKGSITIGDKKRKSLLGYHANKKIGFYEQMEFAGVDITLIDYLNHIRLVSGISKKYGDAKIKELVNLFKLDAFENKKIADLSWGMKNRLNMIISCLKDPEILILDEPGANLDSGWRGKIKEILLWSKNEKRTIIVIAHNIDELIDIADNIVVIEKGKIIFSDKMNKINLYFKTKIALKTKMLDNEGYKSFVKLLPNAGFKIFEQNFEQNFIIVGIQKEEKQNFSFIMAWLIKYNLFIKSITDIPMNMDSIKSSLNIFDGLKEVYFNFNEIKNEKYLIKSLTKEISILEKENNQKLINEYNDLLLETKRPMMVEEVYNLFSFIEDFDHSDENLYREKEQELELIYTKMLKNSFLKKIEFQMLDFSIRHFKYGLDFKEIKKIKKISSKISKKQNYDKNVMINKKLVNSELMEKWIDKIA